MSTFTPPVPTFVSTSVTEVNGPGIMTVTTAIDEDGNIYMYRPIINAGAQSTTQYKWYTLPPIEDINGGQPLMASPDPDWIYAQPPQP
jgi:hypothetical protein